MDWVLLLVAAVAVSELMLRLPLLRMARSLVTVSQKSMRLLQSKRISDHWKERILPAYSARMARASVGFFALLCLSLVPVMIVGLVHTGGVEDWLRLLMRPLSMLFLCAVSIAYIWMRLRLTRV